ncbi:flagella E [Halobacteriales archaeon QS_9_67_15]|nr:MAG: flagella E [Halobacteriales archaeon QS_9_67_15]
MTINPRDYDLNELREMARKRDDVDRDDPRSENLEKPYLRGVPDTYAAEFVVFEWLEFLLMHAGYQGAAEALQYYESIDWITEDVAGQLNDYLLGIDENGSSEGSDLDVDDHMLSLVYVAKLTGMQ